MGVDVPDGLEDSPCIVHERLWRECYNAACGITSVNGSLSPRGTHTERVDLSEPPSGGSHRLMGAIEAEADLWVETAPREMREIVDISQRSDMDKHDVGGHIRGLDNTDLRLGQDVEEKPGVRLVLPDVFAFEPHSRRMDKYKFANVLR
jgi:hypothetical protein